MAINWLQKFADECGDHPPDETFKKRILPACYSKLTIYETYRGEKEKEVVKYSTFSQIWSKYCPHITISKVYLVSWLLATLF